jgi:hypothetical protein
LESMRFTAPNASTSIQRAEDEPSSHVTVAVKSSSIVGTNPNPRLMVYIVNIYIFNYIYKYIYNYIYNYIYINIRSYRIEPPWDRHKMVKTC